jgi:hypothetical protein
MSLLIRTAFYGFTAIVSFTCIAPAFITNGKQKSSGFNLFLIHPIAMSLFLILQVESFLSFQRRKKGPSNPNSKSKGVSSKNSKQELIDVHSSLASASAFTALLGFSVYLVLDCSNKPNNIMK